MFPFIRLHLSIFCHNYWGEGVSYTCILYHNCMEWNRTHSVLGPVCLWGELGSGEISAKGWTAFDYSHIACIADALILFDVTLIYKKNYGRFFIIVFNTSVLACGSCYFEGGSNAGNLPLVCVWVWLDVVGSRQTLSWCCMDSRNWSSYIVCWLMIHGCLELTFYPN